ncbi:hypothetical protein ACLOJK_014778 [Asimina triloba]
MVLHHLPKELPWPTPSEHHSSKPATQASAAPFNSSGHARPINELSSAATIEQHLVAHLGSGDPDPSASRKPNEWQCSKLSPTARHPVRSTRQQRWPITAKI